MAYAATSLAAALLLGLLSTRVGGAQEGGYTLYVDQPRLVVSAEPGTSQRRTLAVTYLGAPGNVLQVQVRDFEALPDDSIRFVEPRPDRPSPSRWIRLPAAEVGLDVERPTPVSFELEPAADAPPGDYGAMLLLQVKQPLGSGIAIQPQVGVRVYTRIPGATVHAGHVQDTAIPALADLEPVRLAARLVNTGTTLLDGAGRLVAAPATLGPLALGVQPPAETYGDSAWALPGQVRDVPVVWHPPGYGLYWLRYDVADELVVDGPGGWTVVAPWRLVVAGSTALLGLWLAARWPEPAWARRLRGRLIRLLGGVEAPR